LQTDRQTDRMTDRQTHRIILCSTTGGKVTRLPKVIWEQAASPPMVAEPLIVPAQTAAPTVHALSHSYTPQTPHWFNGAPHAFAPKITPLPWADPQTKLPASSLDSPNLPSQTASISNQPFCYNAMDRQTDTHTQRPTNGWRECWMTIGRFRSTV